MLLNETATPSSAAFLSLFNFFYFIRCPAQDLANILNSYVVKPYRANIIPFAIAGILFGFCGQKV